MRIENKRSRIESVITKEEWQQMKDQGVHGLFRVLDKDDNFIKQVKIPREITEFKLTRPERIVPKVEEVIVKKSKEQLAEEKADASFNKEIFTPIKK